MLGLTMSLLPPGTATDASATGERGTPSTGGATGGLSLALAAAGASPVRLACGLGRVGRTGDSRLPKKGVEAMESPE
jgi:hypothetical protein